MDVFNSQSLTHFDGYYHRFTKVGNYNWGVFVKGDYVINVQADPGGHVPTSTIVQLEFQTGVFKLTSPPSPLNIIVGDHLLWHNVTPDAGVPVMSIIGDNGRMDASADGFDSQRLGPEDAYSHLFMLPGSYSYTVSEGGATVQTGIVQVSSPNPGAGKSYVVSLRHGYPPNPTPVDIYVGDTVLWDIDDGVNVAIYNVL
jgi:plastocyanin